MKHNIKQETNSAGQLISNEEANINILARIILLWKDHESVSILHKNILISTNIMKFARSSYNQTTVLKLDF